MQNERRLSQGMIKEGTVAEVYGNYGAKTRIDRTSSQGKEFQNVNRVASHVHE